MSRFTDSKRTILGWTVGKIEGEAPEHSRGMDQTAVSADGRIYFNGLGTKEKDFLLAMLRVHASGALIAYRHCLATHLGTNKFMTCTKPGSAADDWREKLEAAALERMAAFQLPKVREPDPFSSEDIVIDDKLQPLPIDYHWKMAKVSLMQVVTSHRLSRSLCFDVGRGVSLRQQRWTVRSQEHHRRQRACQLWLCAQGVYMCVVCGVCGLCV